MSTNYVGLSAEEFADIHDAVVEAMAYVALPVTFHKIKIGAGATVVDPLYGEAGDDSEDFDDWPVIRSSVREQPAAEALTRMGLQAGADLLLFIPRGHILAWEAEHARAFAPTTDMEVTYRNVRYALHQLPRIDELPVGDGTTTDSIGTVITAKLKPIP